MDPAAVTQQIADRLDTIADLRVFPFEPDDFHPPAALIIAPTQYDFDATYGRGSDEMTLPVWLAVSRVDDRASWAELFPYMRGAGPKSFKQIIESGTYTAFDFVRVTGWTVEPARYGGVDYRSAFCELQIAGPGST